MMARELFTLALRIVGVWALVHAVSYADDVATSLYLLVISQSEFPIANLGLTAYWVTFQICPVILGIVLLRYAPKISEYFYGKPSPGEGTISLTISDIYTIAAQIFGIYVLLQAIPVFAYGVSEFFSTDPIDPNRTISRYGVASLIQAALYLACSAFLFFGARRIAHWFVQLRYWPEGPEIESEKSSTNE